MTHVSFYKLMGDQYSAFALICQLVVKSLTAGQQVLCLVPNNEFAEQLDKIMWSFQSCAFIPHGQGVNNIPVAISSDCEPGNHHQILINLQQKIPTWFSRFERMIEIIYQNDDYKQAKRLNYKFYKDRGYPLNFHDLGSQFAR